MRSVLAVLLALVILIATPTFATFSIVAVEDKPESTTWQFATAVIILLAFDATLGVDLPTIRNLSRNR